MSDVFNTNDFQQEVLNEKLDKKGQENFGDNRQGNSPILSNATDTQKALIEENINKKAVYESLPHQINYTPLTSYFNVYENSTDADEFKKDHPYSYTEMVERLDLLKVGSLHFEELSLERFPMLGYAIDAIKRGNIYPTILNAANEVAVGLFLEERISFLDIEKIVKEALDNPIYEKFTTGELTLPKIMSVDELVRIQILTKYR